jgi:hypothetical protein
MEAGSMTIETKTRKLVLACRLDMLKLWNTSVILLDFTQSLLPGHT